MREASRGYLQAVTGLEPIPSDRLAIHPPQPIISACLGFKAAPCQESVAILIPFCRTIVVPENGRRSLGLIGKAKRQVCLDKTVQSFRGMGCGLKVFHDDPETRNRGGVMLSAQIIPSDFHLFRCEMVKGEIEFQLGRTGIIAIGVGFDQLAKLLKGFERQFLIAPDLVDLIIIG